LKKPCSATRCRNHSKSWARTIRSSRRCWPVALQGRGCRAHRGHQARRSAFRKQLLDGGEAAIAGSTDPLVVLGRALDPIMRAATQATEQQVTSIETSARQKIGQARFAVYGTAAYPDATFTLRLSCVQ
jgi:hypothetical protein